MLITPDFILDAITEQAYNPEEHSLFIATIEVVSGNPAKNIAIRFVIYPDPGWRLLPTAMSSTIFGSSFALSTTPLKA